jgi:hypothetical protein
VITNLEIITPSEWIPTIWGSHYPRFDDQKHAETVLSLIML